jgi:hypothetical protein
VTCLGLPDVPRDDWFCGECKAKGKVDEDVDDAGDIPCTECGDRRDPHPKKGAFVLCDGCDHGGGHLVCLGLPRQLPPDDWFCANCEPAAPAAAVTPAAAALQRARSHRPTPLSDAITGDVAGIGDMDAADAVDGDMDGDMAASPLSVFARMMAKARLYIR